MVPDLCAFTEYSAMCASGRTATCGQTHHLSNSAALGITRCSQASGCVHFTEAENQAVQARASSWVHAPAPSLQM